MTRLVNFGLGEICDRVSILALKILHGAAKGIDVAHFQREQSVLTTKLLASDKGKWIELYAELTAVNAALWYAEDMIRTLKDDLPRAGALGLRIAELNDRRSELVQQINAWVGDKVQEKV